VWKKQIRVKLASIERARECLERPARIFTRTAGSNNNRAKTTKRDIPGCGDVFGSGGRLPSSYLVEASGRLFLLDCGPTTLLAMKWAGFDPLMISHLRGDHFGGLPFF
jgi:glyoxylase-like metal-dependent hydrolase (beta-lactamase superfamily II)